MGTVVEYYGLDVKFLSYTHVFEQLKMLGWEVVESLGGRASLEEEKIFWKVLTKVYNVPSSFYTKM